MSVLVGRASQLATIERWRVEAAAGAGRLVLISGDAGIGKTALAEWALAAAAAAGFATARTHAVDDPGAPSLWPWHRLGRALPELRRLLGATPAEQAAAATERFGMFEAISEHLVEASADHGLAVLLDDLHWADPTSLRLLRHVTADLADSRLLLIATARRTGGPAWTAAAAELMRASSTRVVPLGGLAATAVEQWLRSAPELAGWVPQARRITALAGGNPFYVGLLASASTSAGLAAVERPDVVREVGARLLGLSGAARDAVEIAALAGDATSVRVLVAVSGRLAGEVIAALAEARAAEVLGDADPVECTHALVRDAVAAGLTPVRRERLHADIACALESLDDPLLAGAVAEHWRQVAGVDAANRYVTWAQRAAAVEQQRYDPGRAADYLRAALGCAARLDMDTAELAVDLAIALFRAGEITEAVETCRLAADLAERAGRTDLLTAAALVVHGMGDWDTAATVVELCERALRLLPESDAVRRARVLAQLSAALSETVDPVRGAALSVEALRLAESTGDPDAELEAIAARYMAITVPETVHERVELARRAIELGDATARSPIGMLRGHLWLLMARYQLGDLDAALQQADAIRRIADRNQSPIAQWHDLRIQATIAGLMGDFGRASERSADAQRLAKRMGDESMVKIDHAFRVLMGVIRGDAIGDDTLAAFQAGPRIPLGRALLVLALAHRGERDEAAALFEELHTWLDRYATGVRWAGTVGLIGMAAVALGDGVVAGRVYELMRGSGGPYDGDGSGFVVATGSTARPLADLALTAGRVEDAVELYADAVIANSRIGARPFVALARLGWATALLARWRDPAGSSAPPDLATATSLAGQAAAECRRLDMPGQVRAADRLLVELRSATRAADPLTTREREVAALVARGRRNKEIATELVVSERTVESHVHNIMVKLDLGSRAAVAGWLAARGVSPP